MCVLALIPFMERVVISCRQTGTKIIHVLKNSAYIVLSWFSF